MNEAYVGGSKALILPPAAVVNADDAARYRMLVDTATEDGADRSCSDERTEDGDAEDNYFMRKIGASINWIRETVTSRKAILTRVTYIILLLAYTAYLITALVLDFYRARWLLILTVTVSVFWFYGLFRDKYGDKVYERCLLPAERLVERYWNVLKWFIYTGVILTLLLYITFDVRPRSGQLLSLLGFFVILLFMFFFSKHPDKVKFRPVVWGLGLQFIVAVIILRTSFGYDAFKALGDEVQKFLAYTDRGSEFVFGKEYKRFFFVFAILPVIIFFSCVISTLYYLGVMQIVIGKIAWLMQITLGTSATESLCAAGNIFVGQTEAPILVRPFVGDMTKSELHAMMTTGFATIAGGVLAAYIMFGVPAEHLLCASVMNAPVALAVSKLVYPETQRSTVTANVNTDEISKERNVLEAAAAGASASIVLVANIVANLIGFLALLAFVDATLSWFGMMVGHPELSFQTISSYLFMPLAYLLGVKWEETGMVAELLGTKLFLNEFVAYEKLGGYIKNRKMGLEPCLSYRSEIISTYALCGFANLSAIGIQLGGIGPMAPHRRGDLAELSVRALLTGFMACSVTAAVAGLLTAEDSVVDYLVTNTTTTTTLLPLLASTLSTPLLNTTSDPSSLLP